MFFQFNEFLTSGQWNFLIDIAKKGEVTQLKTQKFIVTYDIGTPANAPIISRSLLKRTDNLNFLQKEYKYQVYEVFLLRRLESEYYNIYDLIIYYLYFNLLYSTNSPNNLSVLTNQQQRFFIKYFNLLACHADNSIPVKFS